MNEKNFNLAEKIIGKTYKDSSFEARNKRDNLITSLLSEQKIPNLCWDELSIRNILNDFAMMDSNNYIHGVGVGEREGRIFGGKNGLVSQRSFGMSHGIGRSGDIAALQPKAAGSSLLSKLTQQMTKHLICNLGIKSTKGVLVMPLATGMGIMMSLLTLKSQKPKANYVIWTRIDQKTCLKSMISAGLIPLIVENILEGDQVRTNINKINEYINDIGCDNILCIFSTTSTFAPRVPDKVVDIAIIAKNNNISHIINNAYGIQQTKCINLIEEATRKGRVDCFIQSTDKNFMVPVGGSIIASCNKDFIKDISLNYPGRASASPIIDLFIQYLSMGLNGYKQLLEKRKELFIYMKSQLECIATDFNERVLDTPYNQISLGMTLDNYSDNPTLVGSMLFKHCVSGVRVIAKNTKKQISQFTFEHYGAHIDNYPHNYLTVAVAIGITKDEIDTFIIRLRKTLNQYNKKKQKQINTQ